MQAEIRAFLASLESEPSYSISTRLAYGSDLTRFFDYLKRSLKHFPAPSDVHTQSIASFLENEQRSGKKVNTLLRRKAALRLFIIFLSKNGYITPQSEDDNPIPKKPVQSKLSASTLQFSALVQIRNLLQTIDSSKKPIARRDSAIMALLLDTGLPVRKLISLDLGDVDLSSEKLLLSNGQNEYDWFPLGPSVRYLVRYIKEGRPDLNPYPGETALFISQIGSRLTRQGIWQTLKHWGVLSRASTPISPRAIRHAAILQLAHSGMPLAQIQLLLGHTNQLSTLALLHRLEKAGPLKSDIPAAMAGRE
jgi:integrase/recombinase XerD